ncbi:Carnitine O-acetyltransferase, mitochondrial [Leucoagaricus sp. SymC.cos]|nr:Carnitine O-acetyltransferase, mitochondrial [Leucoagaricus sp. SymC.cos]
MSSLSFTATTTTRPPGYMADANTSPLLRYRAFLPTLSAPTLQSTAAKYLVIFKPLLTPDPFTKTQKAVERDVTETTRREDDVFRRDPAKRVASLVKALLPFRELVESGQLEPEKVKGVPLCMASYKWLFHSSWYRVKPSDTARKFDHEENNPIAVIRENKFFIVSPVDATSGREPSVAELELQFNRIIAAAGETPDVYPVENNPIAVIRENKFFIVSPVDATSGREPSVAELELQFNRIIAAAGETPDVYPVGALTINNRDLWSEARKDLVDATPDGRNEECLRMIESAMIVVALDDTKPITREDVSWGMWVGDGRNRFYDKHQLIVYDNGRSGFLGEHSCMDGTPTLRMNEFILATLANGKIDLGPSTVSNPSSLPEPQQLTFQLNDTVKNHITSAAARFDALVAQHDLNVLHYEGYGKYPMKHYRPFRDIFNTLHGPPMARASIVISSVFKKMLKEGEDLPEIYKDPAFAKSSRWELSTSQLSSKYFEGWGYGEVFEDGFGLSYAIGDDYVRWTITNLKEKQKGAELRHYLAEAAMEVRKMLEAAEKVEKGKL